MFSNNKIIADFNKEELNLLNHIAQQQIAGVMWKTVSESCNLACDYCYYSRCNGRPGKIETIEDEVLEKFIQEYMEIKRGAVPFIWQGGEPLLAGINFFKKVVTLQAKYAPKNTLISNAIQTNGILINEEWANFFKKFNFLVGVSIDGPEDINDKRRITGSGKGSFKLVMRGIDYLRKAKVNFNILTVLHEDNVTKPRELMEFYLEEGFTHVQFIPCMDFRAQDVNKRGQYHITPEQYADFMCEVFDIWYNDGNPKISVRFFDNLLLQHMNYQPEMCNLMEVCPKTIIFEQNGNAYPCDFYIHDDFLLGNIKDVSLKDILQHENMNRFMNKKPTLPEKCKSCEFLHLCHGGCPRNRKLNNGEVDTDYFCESYKTIYRYTHDRIAALAKKLKREKVQ